MTAGLSRINVSAASGVTTTSEEWSAVAAESWVRAGREELETISGGFCPGSTARFPDRLAVVVSSGEKCP